MPENCFHCGLKNSPAHHYQTQVLGKTQSFCCPGCLAVAKAIINNGLEDYYNYRNEFAEKADDKNNSILDKLAVFDDESFLQEFVQTDHEFSEIQLTVSGINCAACGWLIEKQLAKLQGVGRVGVNVAARRATITWLNEQIKLSEILSQIEQIGYHAKPFQPEQHEQSYRQENKNFLKRLGLAGLMTMQVMMLNLGVFFDLFGHLDTQTKQYFNWVSLLLTSPVIFYSAAQFYTSATRAISAKTVNMDVPICVALTVIYLTSLFATIQNTGQTYFESLCMFVFLLLISRYLEHGARYKASQLSANMLEFIPTTASLLENGKAKSVLAKSVKEGQLVLVKSGELIPIDGIIIEGSGQIDEAMLTGEFNLVHKRVGDQTFAGTLNQLGTLTIQVSKELKHSLVNQISRLQTQALASKPKIAGLADKFSQYFVAAVLVISMVTYFTWLTIDSSQALWVTVSVLIATCPCALGLATPSALSCAVAHLNSKGILLKRADALEQITKVNWVGLDKTGTLTNGQFSVTQCFNLSKISQNELLSIAASLEQYSSHPIAKAFSEDTGLQQVTKFNSEVGQGLTGIVNNVSYKIGSGSFMDFEIPSPLKHCNVFLQSEDALLAGFLLQDTIRKTSMNFIKGLKHKTVSLISGDSLNMVTEVANQLNIKNFYAYQTPQQKLSLIHQAQLENNIVLMIGDGINDGPVLAKADVSITLGAGSDLAKSSSDIILLDNNLDKIRTVFSLAKRCKTKIMQNISWAIGYNLIVLPLAFTGYLTPWMAVIGMSLSSLIVVVNSVRLLK
ncbi:cadmium-translocating P-type ATPase [Paraglaciecola aquimarina]|uniref:Cadmium-translocating P-type ATPase n=1 Tax=Paraglaciecola algarum TaxID=3050085 RepID=A0ABS9D4X0_9ALTE|nr:heavy metal translocating P-type ATPase [Paraglaciecola sp. G1-23]MCF2947062.1 cadmium-translocating P-type ATPase [Paraglaciecola sp. G1-23]